MLTNKNKPSPKTSFSPLPGQPRPTTNLEAWNEKGTLCVSGITRSQHEHLCGILACYFEVPSAPMQFAYLCDPKVQAVFIYLLNHRAHVAGACGRSGSKTLENLGERVGAWDRAANAWIEGKISKKGQQSFHL